MPSSGPWSATASAWPPRPTPSTSSSRSCSTPTASASTRRTRSTGSAADFQTTYAGGFFTARQHKALLADPGLQVFDHDQALLACNYDPAKALCAADRHGTGKRSQATPSHNRCQIGCANISRTDSHVHRIREEISRIDEELAADLTPLPIRQRLRQR